MKRLVLAVLAVLVAAPPLAAVDLRPMRGATVPFAMRMSRASSFQGRLMIT